MQAILQTLEVFPDQLEALAQAFAPAQLAWEPDDWEGIPSEHLSALGQLCHLRDIEIDGYQQRFRRTLAENDPLLPSIDTDALALERSYAAADPRAALQAFRQARRETLALLRPLQGRQLDRPARFEGYGPVTLRGLIHFLCSHDQQHLAGLHWLLGRLAAPGEAALPKVVPCAACGSLIPRGNLAQETWKAQVEGPGAIAVGGGRLWRCPAGHEVLRSEDAFSCN